MRVAVVGGGIFGSTAAIYLARTGLDVELFEQHAELLAAASGINQYRLHRGYHYPRSSDTARSALHAEASFVEEYSDAVVRHGRHLYAIAKEGSAVSAKDFLAFCDAHGLVYKEVHDPQMVNHEKVDCLIEGDEAWYDPYALRELVLQKIAESGVRVHTGVRAEAKHLKGFDHVVFAAYAHHNTSADFLEGRRAHQYEVCEKPVVELPASFGLTGIVVMDGPFMCVDPLGRTGRYVLGNVVHAIHRANIGFAPDIPEALQPLLNRGIIENPPVTNISTFIEHGREYLPALAHAKHVGSMYTIRTVLPKMEATDARPTIVRVLDDRHLKIFSGKVGNCVEAAKETVRLLGQ
jgi:glycine/D-amino acid oxidase-like deaminating enzyme